LPSRSVRADQTCRGTIRLFETTLRNPHQLSNTRPFDCSSGRHRIHTGSGKT
jgi:hypothetical protein